MHNVLVTGGAGFIGSNFIRYLLETAVIQSKEPDVQVINLDALTYAGSLENLKSLPAPDNYTFVQGDICDRSLIDDLLHHHQIDTIVHFAAESHVDRSILGPMPFIQTNVVGTFTLLDAARNYWLGDTQLKDGLSPAQTGPLRFHHISTDEVYGSLRPDDPPFSEITPYAPNSPYAASKASSDHLVRAYAHTYGLPVTITNCSNNFGPYQFPEKLIPLMIVNAINGRPLPIYGDGQQIRDWLFVEDHCDAIWTVLRDGTAGETYNIGGGNQPPNLLLVETICNILDELLPGSPFAPHSSLITFVTDRLGHDRRYAMDTGKIQRELSWRPRHSLDEGLSKTVEWYLANPAWLQAIQQQREYQGWLTRNYSQRA